MKEFSEFSEFTEHSSLPTTPNNEEGSVVWDGWGNEQDFYHEHGITDQTIEPIPIDTETLDTRIQTEDSNHKPADNDGWEGVPEE
jgi:hypothetical protein